MRKYTAELIATFFLVFCGTGAIIINEESLGAVSHPGIAASFGLVVSIMIFAFGSSSGAHMNPAVTLSLAIQKKFAWIEVFPYVLSQTFGGVIASFTLFMLFPDNKLLGSTIPAGSETQSFILEFILTFLLMAVILFTAFGGENERRFAPLAIGGTVYLEALFAGPICGASMNPVRSFAPAIVSGELDHLWLYIIATILGALLAGFFWRWQIKEKIDG